MKYLQTHTLKSMIPVLLTSYRYSSFNRTVVLLKLLFVGFNSSRLVFKSLSGLLSSNILIKLDLALWSRLISSVVRMVEHTTAQHVRFQSVFVDFFSEN
jgi:hypothetical protein